MTLLSHKEASAFNARARSWAAELSSISPFLSVVIMMVSASGLDLTKDFAYFMSFLCIVHSVFTIVVTGTVLSHLHLQ